jgi:hypothetical protein
MLGYLGVDRIDIFIGRGMETILSWGIGKVDSPNVIVGC